METAPVDFLRYAPEALKNAFYDVGYLNHGGYGTIYTAISKDRDYEVVIKQCQLTDQLIWKHGMPSEVYYIQKLQGNKGIIKLFNWYLGEKHYFMVTEKLSSDLSSHLQTYGPMGEIQIRQYIYQLAQGLKSIHDIEILHQDLKTQNVGFTQGGEMVIFDLGVSAPMSNNNEYFSSELMLAPETVRYGCFTAKSEVYQLGVILYRMMFGCRPFSSKEEILAKNIAFDCFTISGMALSQLLAKNPAERLSLSQFIDYPWFHF